jgi:lysophospholipase L1-like esterase
LSGVVARYPWAGRLAALALGTLLGLAMAEAMVRWFAPQHMRGFGEGAGQTVADPRYGYVLAPDATFTFVNDTLVQTNSLGLRDHEYGPKAPGELRILSIGDSYTFGQGVALEETFSKVLERRLQARFPETHVSVIVAAAPGWNTRQMTLAFEDLHGPLGADLVLVTFVAGNDVHSNWEFDGQLRQHIAHPLGVLGQHLHTVRLLRRFAWPAELFLGNREPWRIAYTIELLRTLEQEIQAAGLPYLMLVVPARHQIRSRVVRLVDWLDRLGLGWFVLLPNTRVIEHFRQDGVAYVDLLPPLAARDPIEPIVFEYDAHANAAGHRLIAEEVFRTIETPVAALVTERRRAAASR